MADEPKKETPPAEPTGKAKPVTIDDVNEAVAEAFTQLKAELQTELEEQLAAVGKTVEETFSPLVAELKSQASEKADEAAEGITDAVRGELHHLHGLIDNVINTIDKSIGQRISRNVAPRPEGHPLPSQIDAPPPVQGEGAETASSIG